MFKETVEKYQGLLNLRDWRIEVSDQPAQKGAMADCSISIEDHLAVISIGTDWGSKTVTDQLVIETAVHELLHVLLKPFLDAAISRDTTSIAAIEHSLITILEKLLCKPTIQN